MEQEVAKGVAFHANQLTGSVGSHTGQIRQLPVQLVRWCNLLKHGDVIIK